MPTAGRTSLVALLVLLLSALAGLGFMVEAEKQSFKLEITTTDGRVLPADGNYAFAGIEQTLVARLTPPVEGVDLVWSIDPQAIRTFEHNTQDASKHKTIPLTPADCKGQKFSFFFTNPRDGVEVSVRARKGDETVTAKTAFDVRLPRDANRLIYGHADNDPRRSPNGLSASFAITRDHRLWHIGQKLSNGDLPVYATLKDAGNRIVYGDLGYRTDPPRLFDFDYNGSALLGWHGAALDAHRAWRRTFHIQGLDSTTPAGSLPVPGYLQRVPAAKSGDRSRLYGYVRAGEFQNLDQLGRDLVHPWHNRSHTGISVTNRETLMDNHGKSPPAKDDLFWRWHSVVEEVRRALGPDQATVTWIDFAGGANDAPSLYLAFDRKVSFNAPAANNVQLLPSLVTVNGKPAAKVEDVGGDDLRFVIFRLSGFPAPADDTIKVELTETPGIKGGSWNYNHKPGPAVKDVPAAFRKLAVKDYEIAQAKQRKDDIDRILAKLKPADADDLWISYLFRAYLLPADEGLPILVGLLDHPSDQVKGRAVQLLQYLYAGGGTAAVPGLTKLLQDPKREWWVRERAALALGLAHPRSQEAVRLLVDALENKPAGEPLNVGCIEALGKLGPRATTALPALRKQLASTHPAVQRSAYIAIGQIVNASSPSEADLKKLEYFDWKGEDGGFAAHRAVQKLCAKGAFAEPALLQTLRRNPPVYVQAAVIETLGKVGCSAPAVKVLLDFLPAVWGGPGDPLEYKFLSDRSSETLSQMPTFDPQAVPLLAGALSHADPVVRVQAARTLRRFGAKAQPAVDALAKALEASNGKTDPYEIGAYLSAIRAVGPGASGASKKLVELLNERSKLYEGQEKFWVHFIRAYILVTLGDIGVPPEAKPYILDLLNNSDVPQTHGYAAAARALRPEMIEGVAGLQRALKSDFFDGPMCFDDFAMALGREDASCRLEALRALARLGPRAKDALPLISKLADEKPDPTSPLPPWNEEARKAIEAIQGRK